VQNHFTPAIGVKRKPQASGFLSILLIILINDILAAAAALYVFGFGG
jgi:hypothetical protein